MADSERKLTPAKPRPLVAGAQDGETSTRGPTYHIASYQVYPTGFGRIHDQGKHRWCLTVADAGDGWAIRRARVCLSQWGKWELEPPPHLRDQPFLSRCRYSEQTALSRARVMVDRLRVGGQTFDEFVVATRAAAAAEVRQSEEAQRTIRWFKALHGLTSGWSGRESP